MRIFLILLIPWCAWSQFNFTDQAFIGQQSSSVTTWYPTNAVVPNKFWGELTPINGTWNGATHPAVDNTTITIWTNFATSGSIWTSAGTHPTYFVSGGGGNGTSPRLFMTSGSSTVLNHSAISPATNIFSLMFVMNCTATTGVDLFLNGVGTVTLGEYTSKALRMQNNGTGFTGAATLNGSQWYVVSIFQNGSTGTIYTNGVQYATGSVGTVTLQGFAIGDQSPGFHGNISRVWGWYGTLSAQDHASAVAQCISDFGITP